MTVNERKISAALDTAMRYGQIDGDHHKAWVIDQMVRELLGCQEKYVIWVEEYERGEDGPQTYEWDSGIAP